MYFFQNCLIARFIHFSATIQTQQMDTILNLQGIGDKTVNPKGINVMPSDAVLMFQMQGSLEGQSSYPMYDFMKVTSDGNRVHQMKDWLDQATLKGYFGKKRSDLISQRSSLLERNAKEIAASTARQLVIDADAALQRNHPLQHKANSLNKKEDYKKVIAEWASTEPDPDLKRELLKGLKSLTKKELVARVLLYLSPPYDKTFP